MKVLPGYTINETVHEGEHTTVYKGTKVSDNTKVIIKGPRSGVPAGPIIERFRHEYTVGETLKGGRVIRYLSLEEYNDSVFIVSEDIDAKNLKSQIPPTGFSPDKFLELAIEICDGLKEIHQEGIIHKDINPSNIIWNEKTNVLKVIDFGIAVNQKDAVGLEVFGEIIEGSLPYMSPEQTGRMGRRLDYRSDYYSLGITFYKLISNALPFHADDMTGWVHCHISKQPTPVQRIVHGDVPEMVGRIISKLIQKNPEDRYQSISGLKWDLLRCVKQIQTNRINEQFELGQEDISERFYIPQKLYGRERELESVVNTFENAAVGQNQVVFISGEPGVGKTRFIREISKQLSAKECFLIEGRGEPIASATPYFCIGSAFQSLVHQLLTESVDNLEYWKTEIVNGIGNNGNVLINIVADLEKIIGIQPPLSPLPSLENQNRFHLVVESFVKLFARENHPLVVVLDDFQWADQSSVDLLIKLSSSRELSNLMFICAYRDNEIEEEHFLHNVISSSVDIGNHLHVQLSSLSGNDIRSIIQDMFGGSFNQTDQLERFLAVKTKGNPFFLKQLLTSLHKDGLVYTHKDKQGKFRWELDVDHINTQEVSDSAVVLVLDRLKKLPQNTRRLLDMAACVGNIFSTEMLCEISGDSAQNVNDCISDGLTEEVLVPYSSINVPAKILGEGIYRFIHSRVRQAIMSELSDKDSKLFHKKVGYALIKLHENETENVIFDIVGHFNLADIESYSVTEKLELAQLNLQAGIRALGTTAYEGARNFLLNGASLLPTDSWRNHYNLTLDIYNHIAEVSFLLADYVQMEDMVSEILAHAKEPLHKVKIYETKIHYHMASNEPEKAIDAAVVILRELGLYIRRKPGRMSILRRLLGTKARLPNGKLETIRHFSTMNDSVALAKMRILSSIGSACYLSEPNLFPIITLVQVNLSVKHGNTDISANAYSLYGLLLCGVLKDYDAGYGIAKTALSLARENSNKEFLAKVLFHVANFSQHWKDPAQQVLANVMDAYIAALENGDLEYAAWSLFLHSEYSYYWGLNLGEVNQAFRRSETAIAQLNQQKQLSYNRVFQCAISHLIEKQDAQLDCTNGNVLLDIFTRIDDNVGLYFVHFHNAVLSYLFYKYEDAADHILHAETYLESNLGTMNIPMFYFYDGLISSACHAGSTGTTGKRVIRKLSEIERRFKTWASHAPHTHQSKLLIIQGEKSRLEKDYLAAISYFQDAIGVARKNGLSNEEAIACERLANYWKEQGNEDVEFLYLEKAKDAYIKWGALEKAKQLEAILATEVHPEPHQGETTTASGVIDVETIIKATRAISSEIKLSQLLSKLMSIVIENAGAQKGFLILETNGSLSIQASANVDEKQMVFEEPVPLDEYRDLPLGVIHYVHRTRKRVVSGDLAKEELFSKDSYVKEKFPRSVLCLPLVRKETMLGVLYLENNLASHVFSEDRIELLETILIQAAISIDNAKLYNNLESNQQRFVDVLNHSPSIVYIKDLDLNYLMVNTKFEQLLGTTNLEVIGKTDFDFFPNQVAAQFVANDKLVIQKDQAIEFDETDGTAAYMSMKFPLKDSSGATYAICGVSTDITERNHLREMMIQNEKMMSIGGLAAGMAHEINNPLAGIIQNTQILQQRLLSDIPANRSAAEKTGVSMDDIITYFKLRSVDTMLSNIRDSGVKASQFVQNMLSFARKDTGKKIQCHLTDLLDKTVELASNDYNLKKGYDFRRIHITRQYEADLPSVLCEPTKIQQVFLNILKNGAEAMAEKHGESYKPQFVLAVYARNDMVYVSIEDNGAGMDETARKKIFEPFFTTKAAKEGTGLGMSVSYFIIAEDHNGEMSVQSTKGKGTCFCIGLPVHLSVVS